MRCLQRLLLLIMALAILPAAASYAESPAAPPRRCGTDITVAVPHSYTIFDSMWIDDSRADALLLIGSSEEDAMLLAVAGRTENGQYRITAQSQTILLYSEYCAHPESTLNTLIDGRPYFWYAAMGCKDIYLVVGKDAQNQWRVTSGYIERYEEDFEFSFWASDRADVIAMSPMASPIIYWPVQEEDMLLNGFAPSVIERAYAEAWQFYLTYETSPDSVVQDETHRIEVSHD